MNFYGPRQLAFALMAAALAGLAGCKKQPSCQPDRIQWGVQVTLQTSAKINLADTGDALPTVVRFYQLRGELATEDIDFETLWQSEKPKELGESFLSVEEITMRPDATDARTLPLDADATHIMAAALFRRPVGTTWFGTYEIPLRHPEIVCSKAPKSKQYPDPCFFVYLDRNSVSGGETPPPGYVQDPATHCAPLGVTPEPEDQSWRARRRRRKELEENVEDPLRANDIDTKTPTTPKTPQPRTPQGPKTPQPRAPKAPTKPQGPKKPVLPGG